VKPKRGKISQDFLAKLKEKVNLIDVVGEHVVLRKSGSNHSGLCPFHSERTPSFSVSEAKQLYHCYGCKRGGDLVAFVMEIHGLSFPEAVEELAERASIALPKDWDGAESEDPATAARRRAARDKLGTAYKLNRFVAAFYHQQLGKNPAAFEYLRSRGIGGAELVRNFYSGYAPSGWEALAQHLAAKKAPLPLAQELGLIRPSTRKIAGGAGYFDLFRGRAMFPIIDMRGKVAGFGGRVLPGEAAEGEDAGPKYMNSPESFLFQKSRLAFGLFQAQKHIREKDEIVLVEGYFDVVALHAAGFSNSVATCGTALTPDHLAIFRRLGEKLVVLFDGDKAGVAATERAMEIGLENGVVIYGASMPAGLDPDEVLIEEGSGKLVESGKERMQEILSQAQPLIDQRISEALVRAEKSPEDRVQALKQIAVWLGKFKDPVGREVRIQDLRKKLGSSAEVLDRILNPAARSRPPGPGRNQTPPRNPNRNPNPNRNQIQGLSKAETALLQTLVSTGEAGQILDSSGGGLPPGRDLSDLFEYPPARDWLKAALDRAGGPGALKFEPEMAADLSLDPRLREVMIEAFMGEAKPPKRSLFQAALDRLVQKSWARFSQQIKRELAAAEANQDAGLREKLLKDYLDVQRKMKEFTSFYDEA
jgi:DNA primase